MCVFELCVFLKKNHPRQSSSTGHFGCSAACEVTSSLSGGQNIPQISWGCRAGSLSDKDKYELFSRTVAPETSKGPALVALIRQYALIALSPFYLLLISTRADRPTLVFCLCLHMFVAALPLELILKRIRFCRQLQVGKRRHDHKH